MVSFTTAHRWNSLLCPPLGFLFNFLLFWLILRRTPKEMRVHSRILLQTGVIDCLLLISQCIGQITFAYDKKTWTFVQIWDGYFIRQFKVLQNPLFLLWFYSAWLGLHNLSELGVAIQFIYRYLVLNRNMKITLSRYLLSLFATALCTFAMAILLVLGLNMSEQPMADRGRFEKFLDFDQQPLFVTEKSGCEGGSCTATLVSTGLYVLVAASAYSAIAICGWKMDRFVRKNATLTSKLKGLNRQLTKCLIILACIPLFFAFASFLIMVDYSIRDSDWTVELELYLALTMHWLPVLNPLVTIYTNRPYRNALLGRFATISPMPN